jgi:hypothetical protein
MDISKIWNKLNLLNHTTKLSQNSSTKDPSLIGSLTFELYEDNKIKIQCGLPDTSKLNEEMMIEYAEKYANLLFHMSEGNLTTDIYKILDSENISGKDALFNKNILSFWAFFHQENLDKINGLDIENEPVISPINVFRK